MRSILDETVHEATVIELVLAVATGFALYSLMSNVGLRLFLDQDFATIQRGQWLGAPLFAFAVCAALMAIAVYLRMRAAGAFEDLEETGERE